MKEEHLCANCGTDKEYARTWYVIPNGDGFCTKRCWTEYIKDYLPVTKAYPLPNKKEI